MKTFVMMKNGTGKYYNPRMVMKKTMKIGNGTTEVVMAPVQKTDENLIKSINKMKVGKSNKIKFII